MKTVIIWLYGCPVPRVVDHELRRRQIAATFQRHVAAHGLEATTFARVAAEAGISVGLIQHYFVGRDELLVYVFSDLLRIRDERIASHITEGEARERPIREILGAALNELLPLDAQRTRELRVAQALQARSLCDPAVAAVVRRADRDLETRAATAVGNGKQCGEVAAEVDPDIAGARIVAAISGLSTRLLLMGRRRATQVPVAAILDPVVATVFTGRCRHYEKS